MKLQITEPFLPLVDESHPNYKSRYLTWYGGRGGMKTTSISDGLLVRGIKGKERILCGREFQNSIADSVHKTLADEIQRLGMADHYEVQSTGIFGRNGTEFLFRGLKSNIQSIKSIAGITVFWNEEAQTTSQKSIDIIMPTIRAEGSQIINSMNPDLEDDPAYQYFVINPPPDSYVRKVNYTDNPFLPETLRKEAEYCHDTEPHKFNHIWLGECLEMKEGSIYGNWIMSASERITSVPYDSGLEVFTVWDLGYSDSTSIGFGQVAGKEPRIIDYEEHNGQSLDYYVKLIKDKPYNYSVHVLPHDAGHKSLRTGLTLAQQLEGMGLKNIIVLPQDSIESGIELVRRLLSQVWFDKEKCQRLIYCLKKYRYKWDEEKKRFSDKPLHDFASDPCFVAGTKVLMDNGLVSIEKVQVGCYVRVPNGYAKVLASECTGISKSLIELEFDNGRKITCTPQHKFFTHRGLVRADALSYTDILINKKDSVWKRSLLYSMVGNIGFRDAITKLRTGEKDIQACTERFGLPIMGRYLQNIIYTIKMATVGIMIYPILSALVLLNILAFMLKKALGLAVKKIKSNLFAHKNLPNCGTEAMREESGIVKCPKRNGLIKYGLRNLALSVSGNIKLPFPLEQNIATRIVSRRILEGAEGNQLVYDLTVQKHHCFMANGVLVSNCDMMRYMATYLATKKSPIVSVPEIVYNYGGEQGWMG